MNRREIKERVAKIRAVSWDNEAAHRAEDQLHEDFIQHIANSSVRPYSDWAKLILETKELTFSRWCG